MPMSSPHLTSSPHRAWRSGAAALAVAAATAAALTVATPASAAPCGDGTFNAQAVKTGNTWTAQNGTRRLYSGGDMRAAVQAALNSLQSGRTAKQSVLVKGDGTISAGSRITVPSYTILDVCGTITVSGRGSGDQAPIYARGAHDIAVPHLTVRGAPRYGIFLRNVQDVVLGEIDLRLSAGLGIRIDNHGDPSTRSRNIRIDNVYVSGTSLDGVETYGVDGLTIGTVTARDTGETGLMLNDTINATIGTIDADGAATGTGYAAFRLADRSGRVGSAYPANIRVGTVKIRGGGRGIFCLDESGGAVIDQVDIAGTGSDAVLLEELPQREARRRLGHRQRRRGHSHRVAIGPSRLLRNHPAEPPSDRHRHPAEPVRTEQPHQQRRPGELQAHLVLT